MSFLTSLMGLTAWDLPEDQYNYSQLATNFSKIDVHDHSSSKGKQIPTAGLADVSVTTPKIADGSVSLAKLAVDSVNGSKIVDGSISTSEIANSAITTAKIATGAVTKDKIDSSFLPVGSVISWFRPNSSVPIPTGWEVCDGRAWSGITNAWGLTSGNIPNLVNGYVLGAGTAGTGSGTSTPPDIGQVVGSHTKDLAHGHSVDPHVHTVPPHAHEIAPDGAHKHRWITTTWDSDGNPVGSQLVDALQRGSAVKGAEGSFQALYVGGLNRNEYYGEQVSAPMETVGSHNHGGATFQSASQVTTSSGSNTSSSLGLTDIRPRSVGLLFIMRVI